MIETKEVVAFFDRLAPDWDAELIRNDEIIRTILDNAEVCAGKDILDVATGTGVLIGDYLARGVASVTGIDISPKMAAIAERKFPQENVTILCGDVEEADFGRLFDCVVVYNAFPHFPDPGRLIARLASLLKSGGTLTVVTTGDVLEYGTLDTKPQAIKSDGNITLSGGTILSCASSDSGTAFKTDYAVLTNGATLMGIGGKATTGAATSTHGSKKYKDVNVKGGSTLSYDGVSFTIPSIYSNSSAKVIVSSASM